MNGGERGRRSRGQGAPHRQGAGLGGLGAGAAGAGPFKSLFGYQGNTGVDTSGAFGLGANYGGLGANNNYAFGSAQGVGNVNYDTSGMTVRERGMLRR